MNTTDNPHRGRGRFDAHGSTADPGGGDDAAERGAAPAWMQALAPGLLPPFDGHLGTVIADHETLLGAPETDDELRPAETRVGALGAQVGAVAQGGTGAPGLSGAEVPDRATGAAGLTGFAAGASPPVRPAGLSGAEAPAIETGPSRTAEQAAHELTGGGRSLDQAREMVRDYLDEAGERLGTSVDLWGLDDTDLAAIRGAEPHTSTGTEDAADAGWDDTEQQVDRWRAEAASADPTERSVIAGEHPSSPWLRAIIDHAAADDQTGWDGAADDTGWDDAAGHRFDDDGWTAPAGVVVPADAARGCPAADCGHVLAPLPGQVHVDEGDGGAQVGLRCDGCGLESVHYWAVSDTEYEAAFGHGVDDYLDEACVRVGPSPHLWGAAATDRDGRTGEQALRNFIALAPYAVRHEVGASPATGADRTAAADRAAVAALARAAGRGVISAQQAQRELVARSRPRADRVPAEPSTLAARIAEDAAALVLGYRGERPDPNAAPVAQARAAVAEGLAARSGVALAGERAGSPWADADAELAELRVAQCRAAGCPGDCDLDESPAEEWGDGR